MTIFFEDSTMWCESKNPHVQREDMEYLEKIINSVGLQFDPEMEILEFHEMRKTKEEKKMEEQD